MVHGSTMVMNAWARGREAAKRTLKEHPDIRNEIENKVRAEYNLPAIGEEPIATDLSANSIEA